MLNLSKVIAFVATQDPTRARVFYEEMLGLTCLGDEEFALVLDANGTMLRITKVQTHTPAPYTVLGWEVPDIRAAVEALSQRGVRFERFEGFPQDNLGIFVFSDGTKLAWFKDPDGNMLSLTQFPA